MFYNDNQLRAFTQIAYCDFTKPYEYLRSLNPGIRAFSIKALINAAEEIGENYEFLPLYCTTDSQKENWKICAVHDTNQYNGFYACIIETSPFDAVVAFRGSEGMDHFSDMKYDWIDADLGLLNSVCTTQQAECECFLIEYKTMLEKYKHLTLTGHSLGGNLAEYGAVVSCKIGLDNSISECISLDGPGFSNEFVKHYTKEIKKICTKIRHYRWSLVGTLLFDLPEVTYNFYSVDNKSNKRDKIDMNKLTRHDTKYLAFDDKNNLIQGSQDNLSKVMSKISKTVDRLPKIAGNDLKNIVITIMLLYANVKKIGNTVITVLLPFKSAYTYFANFFSRITNKTVIEVE